MNCKIFKYDGSRKVCYLILPMEIGDDAMKELTIAYKMNLVEVFNIDWDNVLTPWPEKNVFPGEEDFKGEAPDFLKFLQERVIPDIEKKLAIDGAIRRQLLGISLSGLFAVWAWTQCDTFIDIASISGSFWFDGFPEWLATKGKVTKPGFIYLSLGDQEGKTKVKRFQPVEKATAEVAMTLREDGAQVVYETTPGPHHAPMIPRIRLALDRLSRQDD